MRADAPALLALLLLAGEAPAAGPEVELGAEVFLYPTGESPLNRGNLLGLDPTEEVLRGTLHARQSLGEARIVVRGFVERRLGGDETEWTLRQAYLQYGWGSGLSLRAGKQRVAWGSGFAWNPTNRVEPPKNPFNTGLEQEGASAVRMDWIPASWAGVILVAARGETTPGDLPFEAASRRRHTAAVRARFLVLDTDLALVFSGGKEQRTLVGFDVGREVAGELALHAEGALYEGAELAPSRDEERFFRLAAGLLWTRGDSSFALEYFYNGEGYTDLEQSAYVQDLEARYGLASDARLPPDRRRAALGAYLLQAAVPYSGGLGLRRHYLHASWTRRASGGKWTLAGRGVVGLSDGGVALTPGISYAPREDVTLHLDGVALLGPEDSEYRLAPVRGALQARVKVLF